MNRRRFLKYAGATAAVVGASALGLDYVSRQTSPPPVPTTSTITHELSSSSTAIQELTTSASFTTSTQAAELVSVQGRLFFDYNGNGIQDKNEPGIAGARVLLKDDTGNAITEAITDSAGDYKVEDIRTGAYRLHIEANKKFRYMCRSMEQFIAVPEGYGVLLDRSQSIDIGLMEGYLTLPFAKGTRETQPRVYVDVDPSNAMRDWHGGASTYNGHLGTDFSLAVGTKILAAALGVVTRSWYAADDGNSIEIKHGDGKATMYCHLNERMVFSGIKVKRGDIIGLSGHTGSLAGPEPHLHFQFGGYGPSRIDPYRNLRDPSSLSYWTVDNNPQSPF